MLSSRMCSAFRQPLFCKQCNPLHPLTHRAPPIKPSVTLGGFRLVRGSNVVYSSAANPVSNIWKPFLFTVGVCSATFVGAAIWRYENLLKKSQLRKRFGIEKLWATKTVNEWQRMVEEWRRVWNTQHEGKKLFYVILGVNLAVVLAWAVPRFQPAMMRYFTCNIQYTGALCWPLLLATCSHAGLLHIGANMYCLHSIIEGAVNRMGLEQFAAFYLSSGVVAAFCSYLWLVATKSPVNSLGASGAVLAVFGYMCTENPDLRLNIIFLPMINFDGDFAIKAVIALSLAGIVFKWGVIDHMAHLCGVLCGVAWSRWGQSAIWSQRKPVIDFWREIRPSILEK